MRWDFVLFFASVVMIYIGDWALYIGVSGLILSLLHGTLKSVTNLRAQRMIITIGLIVSGTAFLGLAAFILKPDWFGLPIRSQGIADSKHTQKHATSFAPHAEAKRQIPNYWRPNVHPEPRPSDGGQTVRVKHGGVSIHIEQRGVAPAQGSTQTGAANKAADSESSNGTQKSPYLQTLQEAYAQGGAINRQWHSISQGATDKDIDALAQRSADWVNVNYKWIAANITQAAAEKFVVVTPDAVTWTIQAPGFSNQSQASFSTWYKSMPQYLSNLDALMHSDEMYPQRH